VASGPCAAVAYGDVLRRAAHRRTITQRPRRSEGGTIDPWQAPTTTGRPSTDDPELIAVAASAAIDLLSVTATGSPNAASMKVQHALSMGVKELRDIYVGMHFKLAQGLLYGPQDAATSVDVQLQRGKDMVPAQARLQQMFAARGPALEVKTFDEITPLYRQVIGLIGSTSGCVLGAMLALHGAPPRRCRR
jgi:hypothetical protein